MNLGYSIYYGLEADEYLRELYDAILYNHSLSLLALPLPKIQFDGLVSDALRFADILSNSNHPNTKTAEKHKVWGQEIVALLSSLYPQNLAVQHYLGAVLSNTGNFRGMHIKAPDHSGEPILNLAYSEFSKDMLRVPANPEKHFFRSQRQVYERFNDPYFSFSGPTSMGKSFVMQSFIKEQVQSGKANNFAIIVPTKALINEMFHDLVRDLKELLAERNYRIVPSAGASILDKPNDHNYIFVLTPERLLYLLIRKEEISIDYLFIDEAHKLSAKRDSRSAFYYKNIDLLVERPKKSHIIFASPNIPNPELYLSLIPDAKKNEHRLSSAYSPVTQIKYLLDFIDGTVKVLNDHSVTKEASKFKTVVTGYNRSFNDTLHLFFDKNSSSIVYINNPNEAMEMAEDFAKPLPDILDPETGEPDKELAALATEIRNLIHKEYYLAKVVTKGVAFHVGYLPPSIRLRIEELYRKQKIRVMFCTSTLLEGVNLPADNLFVTTYYKGNRHFSDVDFRNLIGRVGRIKYNLYGNVFLTRIKKNTDMEKYIGYLENDVPEQKLSIDLDLRPKDKDLIVFYLSIGRIDIPTDGFTDKEYAAVRKYAQILLTAITKNRTNSLVYKAFKHLLTPEKIEKIKTLFSKNEVKPDDDINNSVDQTISLIAAIRNNEIEYPEIYVNEKGDHYAKYPEVLSFLQKLHRIYKWEQYEKDTVGNINSLDWYATLLCQWVSGSGLGMIMGSAIDNAISKMYSPKPKTFKFYVDGQRVFVPFNNSALHRNLVISEALHAIENTILFTFSNHFIKFSQCYEKIKKQPPAFDWYEYVEYGTANSLSIMLQRNGFSREAALYIKSKKAQFVKTENGVSKLRRSILTECENKNVLDELADLIYNAPELFID